MNKHDFESLMVRLEMVFKPMGNADQHRDEILDIYYSQLRHLDYLVLKKAVDFVISTHRYRSFPLIADLISAAKTARDFMPVGVEHKGCHFCGEVGITIVKCTDELGVNMGYTKAVPCTCPLGQAYERAWKHHDRQRRHK